MPQLERATPVLFSPGEASQPSSGGRRSRFVSRLPALALEPLLARRRGRLRRAPRRGGPSPPRAAARGSARSRARGCGAASARPARSRAPPGRAARARAAARPRVSALGALDVEERLDPRRALLRVLAAGPARPAEKRKATSERIDSTSMAAILLDVDGVLHVSGEPIPGAVDAVRRLRAAGHRIRFVTNSTTCRARQLGEKLRALGFAIEDDELQTTGGVASRVLKGKRVLALTMPGLLDDLEGMQLIGMNADAVLIGGADESEETGPRLLVPEPEPRVPRAAGRRGALLPAPEPLVADGRRAAARRRRVRRRARVRGRHRGDRARQAEPGVLRRGARGDRRRPRADLDGRRRPRGRHRRRAEARHAHRARPHRQVPARRARGRRRHARRHRLVDRAAARTGSKQNL